MNKNFTEKIVLVYSPLIIASLLSEEKLLAGAAKPQQAKTKF